nr:hypothetical protein [Tanacetum cinerariifolium]
MKYQHEKHHHPHHLLDEMKIHGYDGRRLKRWSDKIFHDHFGVDGLVLEQNDVFVFDFAIRVVTLKLKKLMNFFRSRKIGVMWSFSVLRVCKSTKILFVCEDSLAIEWNYENLTELLERKSDEFVLNHEGDKNDARVILLKSDLTIKV